jgi:hypothetical protein
MRYTFLFDRHVSPCFASGSMSAAATNNKGGTPRTLLFEVPDLALTEGAFTVSIRIIRKIFAIDFLLVAR